MKDTMEHDQLSPPSLRAHLFWSLLVSLLCSVFILIFFLRRQSYLGFSGADGGEIILLANIPILFNFISSIILWVKIWRTPQYRQPQAFPQHLRLMTRLLRIDAYTYLLLPLLAIAITAWEQIGNIALLCLVFSAMVLGIKAIFALEYKRLSKKLL
jgi:hypothetical protein